MKKNVIVIIMIILLLGILFPFASLSQFYSGYAIVFNSVFDSLLSHILMHMALFAGLAWIMMSFTFKWPMKNIILMSLGCVLLVGVIQESIQMLSVGVFNIGASLFDLGIDLVGGSIPLLVKLLVNIISAKQQA